MSATYDLNSLQYEVNCLAELLKVTCEQFAEMDFGVGENRRHDLDRVSALASVASDVCSDISERIERNFHHLSRGGSSK